MKCIYLQTSTIRVNCPDYLAWHIFNYQHFRKASKPVYALRGKSPVKTLRL